MKKSGCLIMFVIFCIFGYGCQSHSRTDPLTPRITEPPQAAEPVSQRPPSPDKQNPYQADSEKSKFTPAVETEDKASLIYTAKLDLLRVLICSDERVKFEGEILDSDEMLQAVKEHFSDMGFRVMDGPPCPAYTSAAGDFRAVADEADVDIFVLLRAKVKKVDRFGDFYSYEADGQGKVVQISDTELLTTKSSLVRGKRALDKERAAISALEECGKELAGKLTDEIIRKADRGVLLRRIVVDDLDDARQVDYIRVELAAKPGIRSVVLKKWDERSGRAIFWVRFDASVKENLMGYLEELKTVHLEVEKKSKIGVKAEE
jgi:hypothetical protein